ncbi:uncharacterized protein sll1770 [Phtheirospermum japonicum]|uniref:Uncharacterized protein sll1770 n=1 Tax=Phtheirospermum japonicum TaxID=374723 RepID=A0A830DAP5_9LAMI|nr:uncharacterized protein sll1770 [Phtheirospermum japonicum]
MTPETRMPPRLAPQTRIRKDHRLGDEIFIIFPSGDPSRDPRSTCRESRAVTQPILTMSVPGSSLIKHFPVERFYQLRKKGELYPSSLVSYFPNRSGQTPAQAKPILFHLYYSRSSKSDLPQIRSDQSIAPSVHRAILHNGEKVVVKVQRPGLKKLFDIDLKNLKLIAEYFQKSESLGGPTRDWIGIYEECAKILYEEIDYMNKGKMLIGFVEISEI